MTRTPQRILRTPVALNQGSGGSVEVEVGLNMDTHAGPPTEPMLILPANIKPPGSDSFGAKKKPISEKLIDGASRVKSPNVKIMEKF